MVAVVYEGSNWNCFDWERFGVLDRQSLIGGSRLREVVAHGGLTVCTNTHTHTHILARDRAHLISGIFNLVLKATIFCRLKTQPVFEEVIV